MIERTTVRLPSELMDRARQKAATEGRTLTALIEEGLRTVVVGGRKTRPAGRLPISSAKGGPRSDIDIGAAATPEELADLEYVERARRFR